MQFIEDARDVVLFTMIHPEVFKRLSAKNSNATVRHQCNIRLSGIHSISLFPYQCWLPVCGAKLQLGPASQPCLEDPQQEFHKWRRALDPIYRRITSVTGALRMGFLKAEHLVELSIIAVIPANVYQRRRHNVSFGAKEYEFQRRAAEQRCTPPSMACTPFASDILDVLRRKGLPSLRVLRLPKCGCTDCRPPMLHEWAYGLEVIEMTMIHAQSWTWWSTVTRDSLARCPHLVSFPSLFFDEGVGSRRVWKEISETKRHIREISLSVRPVTQHDALYLIRHSKPLVLHLEIVGGRADDFLRNVLDEAPQLVNLQVDLRDIVDTVRISPDMVSCALTIAVDRCSEVIVVDRSSHHHRHHHHHTSSSSIRLLHID